MTALKRDTFISWLKNNQEKFGISNDFNVINEKGKFALHLLPSGIFREGVV